ncbi:triosephosphate isomerase, chloroplastic, partial [Tanacetum coccineum]
EAMQEEKEILLRKEYGKKAFRSRRDLLLTCMVVDILPAECSGCFHKACLFFLHTFRAVVELLPQIQGQRVWQESVKKAIGFIQVREILEDLLQQGAVPSWDNIVIAYEHVRAIGTDYAAPPEQAQEVHVVVRDWLAKNIHRLRQRIECYKRALILATCMGHWNR